MTPRGLTVEDRFWMKAYRESDPQKCWKWLGAMSGRYGKLFIDRDGFGRTITAYAHRYSYELHYGPIPDGLEVDHICTNSDCVNPAHLALVTGTMNKMLEGSRQAYCINGHHYSPENTYVDPTGYRRCRTCAKERAA